MPELKTILIEAGAVGVLLVVTYLLVITLLDKFNYYDPLRVRWAKELEPFIKNKSELVKGVEIRSTAVVLFLVGAVFHLAAQYVGLNEWYVKQYKV